MINAHFNAHEIPINAQLNVHYHVLIMCNILTLFLLSMFIIPKHLKLIACGSLSCHFAYNPHEGYRTPIPNKIPQTQHNKKPTKAGRAGKAGL